MTVTIRALLEQEDLNLVCLAGHDRIDEEIRWVHVSEVIDPTPWLKGGEFLITTGLLLSSVASMRGYVDRLADHKVAGIGFGVGVGKAAAYETVPPAVVETASARDLPLIEVPFDTPYVAVSEFVTTQLASEQFTTVQRAYDAQRHMTAAALEQNGRKRVVSLLARLTGAWCAVTTTGGHIVDSAPSGLVQSLAALANDFERVRVHGTVSQLTEADGTTFAIYPVGSRRHPRQLLIVRKEASLDNFDRMVISGAVTILSIDAERRMGFSAERHATTERLGRIALRPGTPNEDRRDALMSLSFAGTRPVSVLRLMARGSTPLAVAESLSEVLFGRGGIPSAFVTDSGVDGSYTVILETTARHAGDVAVSLFEELDRGKLQAGVSDLMSINELPTAYHQAELALHHAMETGSSIERYGSIPLHGVFLSSIPVDRMSAAVSAIFAPLDRIPLEEKEESLADLRAYLGSNGNMTAASVTLGIHRQTLVKRIAKIERRLKCDMESADDRSALWLALLALDFPR